MPYTKLTPVVDFQTFEKKAKSVINFMGSSGVRYKVEDKRGGELLIRRLDAVKKSLDPLNLEQLYKALTALDEFDTKRFMDFVPGVHSPARGLLLHLKLIRLEKIIFFNTGWMHAYRGLRHDSLQGGGKHVAETGWGSEIFNFLPYRNKMYGYVQPKIDKKYSNPSTIKIEMLGASTDADFVDGVTVVWTANHPENGGTRVVGWYKDARVYRNYQSPPENANRMFENELQGYFTVAKATNCTLLPVDARLFPILRREKGWLGQSNVWYATKNPAVIRQIKEYIKTGKLPEAGGPKRKKHGSPRQPDILKRLEVERRAVLHVIAYYERLGYVVESVEEENLGFDLTATNNGTTLNLEVKGLSGTVAIAELTVNEYAVLGLNNNVYRVCIVTNVLHKPRMQIFSYSTEMGEWADETGMVLKFEERTSARIYAV